VANGNNFYGHAVTNTWRGRSPAEWQAEKEARSASAGERAAKKAERLATEESFVQFLHRL
jgi:hypothetical protein